MSFSSPVHDSNLNMCSAKIEGEGSGWCLTRGLDEKSSSLPCCSNTTRGCFSCAPMELEEESERSAHRSTPPFSLSLDRFSSHIAATQLEVATQIEIEKERRMPSTWDLDDRRRCGFLPPTRWRLLSHFLLRVWMEKKTVNGWGGWAIANGRKISKLTRASRQFG